MVSSPMRTRNALVPELAVRDIARSLAFYVGTLGFSVRYERPEEGFAFISLGDADVMLDEIGKGRTFQVAGAPLDHPLGRGLNLQIVAPALDPLLLALERENVPLILPVEDRWYRTADHESGVRQFAVADPDGYLLRFIRSIGRRPLPTPRPSAARHPPDRA